MVVGCKSGRISASDHSPVAGRRASARRPAYNDALLSNMTHSTAASLRTHSPRLAVSLAASLLLACLSNHPASPPPPDSARAAAFLDTLEERTFHYFWDLTNPQNGLTPDRAPSPSFPSIPAVGFALTASPIGIERGYITRAQPAARTPTTLRLFRTAPQHSSVPGAARPADAVAGAHRCAPPRPIGAATTRGGSSTSWRSPSPPTPSTPPPGRRG